MDRIATLPNEIQYKIMSYSYNVQTPLLCDDIRNYHDTLKWVSKQYYAYYIEGWNEEEPEDKNWFSNDIYSYMNDYYPLCMGLRESYYNIINRSFVYSRLPETIKKGMKVIHKNVNSEINIIWALLTPYERDYFINSFIKNIDIANYELIDVQEEDYDY